MQLQLCKILVVNYPDKSQNESGILPVLIPVSPDSILTRVET